MRRRSLLSNCSTCSRLLLDFTLLIIPVSISQINIDIIPKCNINIDIIPKCNINSFKVLPLSSILAKLGKVQRDWRAECCCTNSHAIFTSLTRRSRSNATGRSRLSCPEHIAKKPVSSSVVVCRGYIANIWGMGLHFRCVKIITVFFSLFSLNELDKVIVQDIYAIDGEYFIMSAIARKAS